MPSDASRSRSARAATAPGRTISRNEARRRFTVADQERATAHVEYRKNPAVIDEIPLAYKDIDAVMHAQRSLVEVVHTLRQMVCVKD